MGIVSATGRGGLGIENYEDFIQTDAAINPGNSGGALIDLHGNLVGLNTAILTGGSGGNQGVGFAIPVNMVRNVMDQILAHGKVVRGYLGIFIQDLTPELAKQFGLSQGGGVLVGDVSPDTPASRAGLKKGDVILKLNGAPIDSRRSACGANFPNSSRNARQARRLARRQVRKFSPSISASFRKRQRNQAPVKSPVAHSKEWT